MPRKLRQLKAELRLAGFFERTDSGKGSHTRWFHPRATRITLTLSGADGDDAFPYQEKAVRHAITAVQQALAEETQDG